jgi:hypothetical protein
MHSYRPRMATTEVSSSAWNSDSGPWKCIALAIHVAGVEGQKTRPRKGSLQSSAIGRHISYSWSPGIDEVRNSILVRPRAEEDERAILFKNGGWGVDRKDREIGDYVG